ncbi:Formamidopyrimidine-DNA glycosylase [Kaumoebavirus]|uniref:Formamidopyrimidine-DNA glycosylase n=1 Tax=Kaumoebavirus TaxID=1859492 RepID=UPI0009C3CE69|nr:Formamidopyrimidine-DNA glycosylase [Kaumoebavirus]ARA71990.1 Formamidopyrimidine-DNA glycosylase [Kaumoebavirus]
MPELPECKLMAERLNKFLGKSRVKITLMGSIYGNSKIKWARMRKKLGALSKKLYLHRVYSHGKLIIFDFGELYLVNWLGMTGHWRPQAGPHTHLKMAGAVTLYYDDFRHFGGFDVFTADELDSKLRRMGPDAWTVEWPNFRERLLRRGKDKMIGVVLMDQKVVAGLGNYLRADILYKARINPKTKVSALSPTQLQAIYKAMRAILKKSYDEHGTTIKTYKALSERGDLIPGRYKPLVYGREYDAGGNPVKSFDMAGRTMWWCPAVQG